MLEFANSTDQITLTQIIVRIFTSFGLNILALALYSKFYKGFGSARNQALTFLLVGLSITCIIIAIGSNLALSLGLVGALSIVRFRSAVKENRDLAYLFWIIAIGLVSGVGNFELAISSFVIIGLCVGGYEYYFSKGIISHPYILILRGNDTGLNMLSALSKHIEDQTIKIKSTTLDHKQNKYELVFMFRPTSHLNLEELVKLIDNSGVGTISILTPDDSIS